MKHLMEKLEQLLELGGIKKDVTFLVISGIAVICSLLKWKPLPFDMAWVAVCNAVTDTVLDVPLQHDLSAAVQRGFRGVDLRQNILTGHILVNHAVDGLHLSNDFFKTAMQVLCIHALLHLLRLHTIRGMFIIRYAILLSMQPFFRPLM